MWMFHFNVSSAKHNKSYSNHQLNWIVELEMVFFLPIYYVRRSSNEVISWRIELVYMPRQKLGLLGIFINSRLNLVRPHPAQHVPYRLLSSPWWRTSQKRKVPESWLPYTSSCHEQQQPILKKKRKGKLLARESRTASKSAKVLQKGVGEVDGEEDEEEAGGPFRLLLRLDQRGIRTREKKRKDERRR